MNDAERWNASSVTADSVLASPSPAPALDSAVTEPEGAISPVTDASTRTRTLINRTRTGCRTCRHRKVKCDEEKPVCTQCRRGKRNCTWSQPDEHRAPRSSRRPNATACLACREKKLKCIGSLQDVCNRCRNLGLNCIRNAQESTEPGRVGSLGAFSGLPSHVDSHVLPSEMPPPMPSIDDPEAEHQSSSFPPAQIAETTTDAAFLSYQTNSVAPILPIEQAPTAKEIEDLVQLYFSSVHNFGYYAFIHQLHFNRLLYKGKAPRELTLIMMASAMRFAAEATPENLSRADRWADMAIEALLPRIYQGFGAIQLMTLLLAQQYDLNRGNFTSAWLLGANCTRMMQMMSLQTFDRTYSGNISPAVQLSPLLSHEALRRVAWSTFYADTIIDGGRYGFHIIDEKSFRLQLPCDQASFLSNEDVVTEPLFDDSSNFRTIQSDNPQQASLDMSAYLLRAAAARRRALHFAFRASHKEQTAEELGLELVALEADMEQVINALPRRFYFSSDNMYLHRDRLITFILLHILRHNLFIVVGRAALQVHQRDPAKVDLIPQVRRDRISHALPIAGLVAEGLKAGITFDPQIGVQAYVALEILLFEPRRLAEIDSMIDPKASELMDMIPHLLAVIREIANRSEFVKQLHIEAVHRLLRCDCTHLLNQTDFDAFRSEYRLVGQDDAEYDFRDFRWAKLERIRRGARSSANMARDEALLEYKVGGETAAPSAAPSPRLDAMDVGRSFRPSSDSIQPAIPSMASPNGLQVPEAIASMGELNLSPGTTANQPWWGLTGPTDANQEFSLNWSWLLDESGHPGYQTGDPNMFWSQL